MLEGSYTFKVEMDGNRCNDVEGIEHILFSQFKKCGFTNVRVECIDFDINEMEE